MIPIDPAKAVRIVRPFFVRRLLNDKDSAKTVIDKIKAIGNVEYSSESKQLRIQSHKK